MTARAIVRVGIRCNTQRLGMELGLACLLMSFGFAAYNLNNCGSLHLKP